MAIQKEPLLAQCAALDRRYAELENKLVQQAASLDRQAYQQDSKELSQLRERVQLYREYRRIEDEIREAELMAAAQGDPELREMAKDEVVSLRRQETEKLQQLAVLCRGDADDDARPIMVEIRAATGGLESSLFAGDLYRLYTKYAAKNGLVVELMETSPSEAGGFKEIVFSVKGAGASQRFRFESGVHRVQRVPATESQGRIHTSTVTVAVMPEPEEVELPPIPAKDLEIDVYRSTGAGGQSVNTTDSAVRIRHIPTGLVVTCQDERSQLRNKERAMRVLRARLLDHLQQTKQAELASSRRLQVGTGERSEKIRTYNFPDRRVTDHRVGLTLHKFDAIFEGNIQEFVDALSAAEVDEQAKRIVGNG